MGFRLMVVVVGRGRPGVGNSSGNGSVAHDDSRYELGSKYSHDYSEVECNSSNSDESTGSSSDNSANEDQFSGVQGTIMQRPSNHSGRGKSGILADVHHRRPCSPNNDDNDGHHNQCRRLYCCKHAVCHDRSNEQNDRGEHDDSSNSNKSTHGTHSDDRADDDDEWLGAPDTDMHKPSDYSDESLNAPPLSASLQAHERFAGRARTFMVIRSN
jgi:hypothetical protein